MRCLSAAAGRVTRVRPLVIVPGIDDSGPAHWQTLWERELPSSVRIAPGSWSEPELDDWLLAIDDAVQTQGPDAIIVAHSMGCPAAVEWLIRNPGAAAGVVLVAPADDAGPAFERARSFIGIAQGAAGAPALLIASENDPYCSPERVREFAARWSAKLVSIGDAGHVNALSGLGEWPEGRELLVRFAASLDADLDAGERVA